MILVLFGPAGAAAAAAQGRPAPDRQPATRSAPSRLPSPPPTSIFLGGVPSGQATAEPIVLTLLDAINRALDHNLGVLTAEQSMTSAAGARLRALSDLLPNVSARVSETRQEVNLAAFGFRPAGFPAVVGPYNVFDARVFVSQAILDLQALNETRAETHNVAAAQLQYKSARDLVVLVAGNGYLQALAAASRADSVRAQLDTAQALYMQAGDLKQAGLVAGIDVLRAEVQLNLQKQRSTAALNEFEKAKLQLARLIGLPIGQAFTLNPTLPDIPAPDLTLDVALDRAYRTRGDYLAAQERVRAAESSREASAGEGLPTVRVNADYGDIGLTPADSRPTFAVSGSLTVPILQSGRTRGRLLEAGADLRNRRAELEDMKAGIYYEVRMAFLDLQAGREQLDFATRARELASQQLTQARDRFTAGVADNLAVIQAQEAVAVAADQYIAALLAYNLAKGGLVRGLGTAEETARQYLGGSR